MPINSGFDNFIPEIWADELLRNLDKNLVIAGLVNMNYQGNITARGDTVRINQVGSITFGSYTAGSISYEEPSSSQQTLTIDNDFYFAFKVDDLDRVQANIELIRPYAERAAFSMADRIDIDLAEEWANAGDTTLTWDVGTDDAYDVIVNAGEVLDNNNVPRGGRWLVVTPKGYADLLKNSNFIHATVQGDRVLRTGEIGSIAGFTVFMSRNLVNNTASTYQYMYGTREAITHARQLTGAPEPIRLESDFATGLRGRLAWGNLVVQSAALGAIAADES